MPNSCKVCRSSPYLTIEHRKGKFLWAMKTIVQHAMSAEGARMIYSAVASASPQHDTIKQWSRLLQRRLVVSSRGRIVLHLVAALRTGHWLWHWQGIIRELSHA